MKTLGARIRAARERSGLNQSELGWRVGVRPQTVNQWESDAKAPSRDNFALIVQTTGCDATWLLYGGGTSEHTSNPLGVIGANRGRRVPKVTVMEAVSRNPLINIEETVFANFPCGPRSFAFILPNDACAPLFPRGTLWIVDPDREPHPGSMVVAVFGDTPQPVIGEYREEVGSLGLVRIVTPVNPKWAAYRSDRGSLEILAAMTESARPAD